MIYLTTYLLTDTDNTILAKILKMTINHKQLFFFHYIP